MALTDKQMREMIKKVREYAPNMSSNDITLILEYYNYNVEQTVASILENGGQEALQQWQQATPKSSVPKARKKKNKKPSANSPQNITTITTTTMTVNNYISNNGATKDDSPLGKVGLEPIQPCLLPESSAGGFVVLNGHVNGDGHDDEDEEEDEVKQKLKEAQKQKGDYKQMSKKERDRTISEIDLELAIERTSKNPHAGLEKSCKELQRQSTSLQHLKVVLKEQMDKSCKRVNEVFKELRQQMIEREAELMFLLDKSKAKASEVLATYELKAADLKLRTDRAQAMCDKDVAILRSDIKHFVGDHKHYEEVATSQKFTCDFNKMLQSIQQFGEVPAVRGIAEYQAHIPINNITQTSDEATNSEIHHHIVASSAHILNQSESLTKYENQTLQNRIAQMSLETTQTNTMQSTSFSNNRGQRPDRGRGGRGGAGGGGIGNQFGRGIRGGRGRGRSLVSGTTNQVQPQPPKTTSS